MKQRIWILLALILGLNSCDEGKHTELDSTLNQPLFEFLDPAQTNIDFANNIGESERFNILLYENLYNGGGVALGDINNDGLVDLYFSGNTANNRLYLNQGNFKFKDITQSAGVTGEGGFKTGVSMVDLNQDGYLDIYVCRSALASNDLRKNVLYINNGDSTFREMAEEYGVDDDSYSAQAYFLDSDNDGDLDLYLINHPNDWRESNAINLEKSSTGGLVKAKPKSYDYISDRYYENTDSGFVEKTERAGLLNNTFSHSAVVGDFNEDNLLDIYVCNDYIGADQLFINQGNHQFKDEWEKYFSHTSFSSMGSDFGDLNNDGHFDLFTLDMSPKDNYRRKMMSMAQNYDKFEVMLKYDFGAQFPVNAMQINNGNGKFSDLSFIDFVGQTEWSWSVLLADFDNDGNKDIHVTNGYLRDITNNDYRQYEFDGLQRRLKAKELTLMEWIKFIPSDPVPSFLFQNKGGLRFENVSESWNSGPGAFSSGSAYADLNNDGFIDLVVNNVNSAPYVMKNNGGSAVNHHWLAVDFDESSKPLAYGGTAKLTLSDGTVLYEKYQPNRGFYSSSQHRLHFGLGPDRSPKSLEITWPDQSKQTWTELPMDTIFTVAKSLQKANLDTNSKEPLAVETAPLFREQNSLLNPSFKHEENPFIDFKGQLLLHKKLSEQGPALAIGDVNSDGLDDVFIGGAASFSGKLMLQSNSGRWIETNLPFSKDAPSEDVDALFFDADKDGDLDLYVVSGGNEFPAGDARYKDRLYLNDGRGGFALDLNALPNDYNSGGVVVPFDHDNDGLTDLFVGSYVTPGQYPVTPKSVMLHNNGGRFENVTSTWSVGLESLGMINDATFDDLNGDQVPELILSGEWLPITIFSKQENKWVNQTKAYGLDQTTGWWHSVSTVDVNGDGLVDIIGGNLGLNSIFKASKEEPTTLYFKDFDNNSSMDPILCTYVDGVSYPILNRDRLLNHMVMLKKRFTRYAPYARATIEDIFTKEELKDADYLEATTFEHTLYLNNGQGGFTSMTLPFETQWSVLNSVIPWEFDNGQKALVLAGNYYGTDAEFGRYDASIGSVLKWDNGKLETISASTSGLILDRNVRHLKHLDKGLNPKILVVRNNDEFSLYGPSNSR